MSQKLTPGMYAGTVRSGVLLKNEKGKLFVAFVCDVIARVASPRDEPLDVPLTRTIRRYLTEEAQDYTVQDLRNLGWAGNDFAELQAGHPRQHDFAGTPCRLLLKYQPYQGQDAAKAGTDVEDWQFRMGRTAVSGEAAGGDDIARLNAALRVKLAATPAAPRPQQQAPARQAPPQQQAYAEDADDKIPF